MIIPRVFRRIPCKANNRLRSTMGRGSIGQATQRHISMSARSSNVLRNMRLRPHSNRRAISPHIMLK